MTARATISTSSSAAALFFAELPKDCREGRVVVGERSLTMRCIHRYKTPEDFDDILMSASEGVLTGLWFEGTRDDSCRKGSFALPALLAAKNPSRTSCDEIIAGTCRWLDVYFGGRVPAFTPPYRIDGLTPFRREVVDEMLAIPSGKTTTYGEIAAKIAQRRGMEKMSARAVGQAVGWNPICLIIPCHRVLGANGAMTGYGGGIRNKIGLLRLEGRRC